MAGCRLLSAAVQRRRERLGINALEARLNVGMSVRQLIQGVFEEGGKELEGFVTEAVTIDIGEPSRQAKWVTGERAVVGAAW